MLRWMTIASVLFVAASLSPEPAWAEDCVLVDAAFVHKTKSLKSRKRKLEPGTMLTVVKPGKSWTKVKIGPYNAYIRTKALKKTCTGPAPVDQGLSELEATQQALPEPRPQSAPVTAAPVVTKAMPPAPAPPVASASGEGEPTFGETYRIKVAVMQLGASPNVEASLSEALTQVVPETLEGLGVFKAISTQEIKQLLAFESQKQLLGCNEVSCLAEIGGALGADFLVIGNLSLVGDTYIIQLQLANIAAAKIESRASREYSGDTKGLFAELRTATRLLVRDLLGQKSGELSVAVAEEGATIKLDGAIVGVSPLSEPLSVAGGLHELTVEKEGYVVYRADVNIVENKQLDVTAKLIPSPEFISKYKRDASFTRTLAWIGIGAGAAALAGGVALYFVGASQAVDLQDDVRQYNALTVRPSDQLADLDRREQQLALLDTLTLTTALLGVAAATTGTVLLFTGDDPDRYDTAVSPASSGVSAQFIAGPSGVGLSGRF